MSGFNKCAVCKKFITVKNSKKRFSDGSGWLKYSFEQVKITIKVFKQLHDKCYRELSKKKNDGTLIED